MENQKKINNKISGGKYENKYYYAKKLNKDDETKNKKIEKDLQNEFNNNEIVFLISLGC